MRRLEKWRQGRAYIPERVRDGFRRWAARDDHAWYLACAWWARKDTHHPQFGRRAAYPIIAREYIALARAVRIRNPRRLP